METYKIRVIDERASLSIKIEKLGEFIRTAEFSSIHSVDQFLLMTQRVHMICYLDILDSRIARF